MEGSISTGDRSLASLLNLESDAKAYAWLIGREVDGQMSSMIFGIFTEDINPPQSGWIYVGRNITSTVVYTPADYQGTISRLLD